MAACSATFTVNSYPYVRRTGTLANGFTASAYYASIDTWPFFFSDVGLEYISILRTTPPFAQLGTAHPRAASNTTYGQNEKRDFLEVGDVVSFDVVMENGSEIPAVGLALGELVAGATISVRLGCSDSDCSSWMGVGGASMFEASGWVLNEDPAYAYSFSIAYYTDPVVPDPHVVLTANTAALIDTEDGNVLGSIIGASRVQTARPSLPDPGD